MADLLFALLVIGLPCLATFGLGYQVGRSRQMDDEMRWNERRIKAMEERVARLSPGGPQ